MSSLKILLKKQAAVLDDTIDIRCFLRPMAVSTLVKEQSRCDGQVVDVSHMNDIAEQNCSNCNERKVGNEVKKCGFPDWCAECDASLWATNPDVICTGITGSYKRNHVISSDEDVAVVQTKRKRQIKDESSVSDYITFISSHTRYDASVQCYVICCSSLHDAYIQVDDDGSELDKKHRFEDEAVEEAGSVSSDEDDDDEDAEVNAEDAVVEEAGSDASDEDGDDEDEEVDADSYDVEDEEDDADSCADDAVAEACAALRNRRSFKVIVWRIE